MALASPSRSVVSVDPTMSVNKMVRNADSECDSPTGRVGVGPRNLMTVCSSTSIDLRGDFAVTPYFALDFDVLGMCGRELLGSHGDALVAVHVGRHRTPARMTLSLRVQG